MKTIQEVFNLKVGDMIIKHIHTKHSNRNYWSARIRIENREYSVGIEEELTYDNKVYYMGYIKNTFLRKERRRFKKTRSIRSLTCWRRNSAGRE